MFIHGAWLSSRSWERFADYFEKRGFAVSAPEWPRKHGDVEELRQDTEALKGLGIDGDRRPLRGVDPCSRPAAGPDRPLLRRVDGRVAARPWARTRRSSAQSGPTQGDPRAPVLLAEGRRARSRSPVEVARGRDVDAGGVRVRVREHVLFPRTQLRRTSATRSPRRARSSTRPASPTSTSTHRPRCTSRTRIARRC